MFGIGESIEKYERKITIGFFIILALLVFIVIKVW